MRKYIEQETAVSVVERLARKCGNKEMAFALSWAARELLEVPAAFEKAQVGTFRKIPADVTRCRNCRHLETVRIDTDDDAHHLIRYRCQRGNRTNGLEWFCADGERSIDGC